MLDKSYSIGQCFVTEGGQTFYLIRIYTNSVTLLSYSGKVISVSSKEFEQDFNYVTALHSREIKDQVLLLIASRVFRHGHEGDSE